MNPYLAALPQIPAGQTRSFMELAAMAGRPGAARAAGRAIAECRGSSSLPWHRVVTSDGRPHNQAQLLRLRREGARPRAREPIAAWAQRVNAHYVGAYRQRHFLPRGEARLERWNAERVEAFASESAALARGFTPVGSKSDTTIPLPRERPVPSHSPSGTLLERYQRIDWATARAAVVRDGVHRVRALLTPAECVRILNASTEIERFERSIDMLPRGYGVGSYHYYREPLPQPARALRELLYRELAPEGYPGSLSAFWRRCRQAGQRRASSILIGYGEGGINHPHRDVYGPVSFPFQALIALTKRGRDFTGGEFYVADEADAAKVKRVAVDEGDVVLFASRDRFPGGRRVPLRHGMTTVTRGVRYGLGVVFHLAE